MKAYFFLLHYATNQAFIYSEEDLIEEWAEHVKKGVSYVDSPLETAMRSDAERELELGKPT